MQNFSRLHHQHIQKALMYFNVAYLAQHNILFGGGTRIALQIHEYRESVDIDFLCPHTASFRAVRQQVAQNSLGELVLKEFNYAREIRSDRDAIRTIIDIEGMRIKLEFVAFANYELTEDSSQFFCVPAISQESCFFTKLLANADRYNDAPFKDIFDILAMFDNWGNIPEAALQKAYHHYSKAIVLKGLRRALEDIIAKPHHKIRLAVDELSISEEYAQKLVLEIAPNLQQLIMSKAN